MIFKLQTAKVTQKEVTTLGHSLFEKRPFNILQLNHRKLKETIMENVATIRGEQPQNNN